MNDTDLKYIRQALGEAAKCQGEDDDRSHPKVGAVAVRDGNVLASAYRGELQPGEHAEYTALERKLSSDSLVGATIYTTLEPCTTRNHPKVPCAHRLVERRVRRIVIGMLDPNERICGRGLWLLRESGIETDLFPHEHMAAVEELNREFIRSHRPKPRLPGEGDPLSTSVAVAPPKEAEESAERTIISNLLDSAKKADFAAAAAALRELQDRRTAPLEKERLQLLFWLLKVKHAQDAQAREELKKAAGSSGNGAFATKLIATLEEMAGNLEGATNILSEASSAAGAPDDKASFALKIAELHRKTGETGLAVGALRSVLSPDLSPAIRARVLAALAETVTGEIAPLQKAALLSRAASLNPNRDTQFSAAYALDEAGLFALSAVYYDLLLNASPGAGNSLNNIGVAFERLSLPGMGIEHYRRSAEAGYTLAMANLAYHYLNAGFYREAEELIKKGRLAENPHENIGSAMVALAQARKNESERWEQYQKVAFGQRRFLNELADAIAAEPQPEAFVGSWSVTRSTTTALEVVGSTVRAAWEESAARRQFRGAVVGKALFGFLEEWQGFWQKFETKGTLCLILRDNGSLSGILLTADGSFLNMEWHRAA